MPDRDQHVDRLLREAMTGPVRAATADCLAVETIAAWSDGSLRPDERLRAETHAATCTRCQSMLAAMIRMEPVVAAAAPSPFRKWLVMLGPALGAAAAVALWFAIDDPVRSPMPADTSARVEQRAASGPQQEEKERASAVAAAPTSQAAPAESLKPSLDALSSRRENEADKNLSAADARKRDAVSPEKPLDRFADAKRKSIGGDLDRLARAEGSDTPRVVGSLPPPAASPPPPPLPVAPEPQRQDRAQQLQQAPPPPMQITQQNAAQQQNTAQQNTAQQNAAPTNQAAAGERRAAEPPAAAAETVIVRTGTETARDASTGAGRGRAAGAGAGAQGYLGGVAGPSPSLSTFNVPTSNPATRYRALLGRNIQRSTDGGTTWSTVRMVAPPTVIVAGASPSPAVCWLAGTGGIVLSTADGVTWREAKLPEAGEIKSIAAVDANTATVTLTDGRQLTTTNGGTSWAGPK